jgi:hypothetical protein
MYHESKLRGNLMANDLHSALDGGYCGSMICKCRVERNVLFSRSGVEAIYLSIPESW